MGEEIIKKLKPEIQNVYRVALPYLNACRSGDKEHVWELIEDLLTLRSSKFSVDMSILVPAAILHDIGHCQILPEHFAYLTGPKKLKNSKLVHMILGAKIARDILREAGYDPEKSKEIIDIVAMHDADKIEEWGLGFYDTENKKIFHDFDRMGLFSRERMEKYSRIINMDDKEKTRKEVERVMGCYFFPEFKKWSEKRLKNINFLL